MKQLLFFSLLFLITITNAQTNLVKNGGFESDLTNWQGDAATISPYDIKSGKKSAVINQFVGEEWKGIDQLINIPKNTYAVECSIWIKSESIEEKKESYKSGLMIAEFTDNAEKKISSENITEVKGTTAWTLYKKTVTVPENAMKIRIMIALAQTSGSLYFDDVKITIVPKPI